MSKAYVLLPDVQYTTEAKTRHSITQALNKALPQGNFKAQSIIFAKKENRYNAFIQTTPEVETKLLQIKSINLGGVQIPTRRCFPQHQVYINKLSDSITKQDIQTYFTQFGNIIDVQLLPADHIYDNHKGNFNNKVMNINHCYIRFQSQNDVEKCLFSQNKHTIKNNDIRAVRAFKIGQNDQTDRKLFLKLSPTVQFDVNIIEFELYNLFKKYGELREKIRIQQISNSSSKSIITFTSIEGGQKALKECDQSKIHHYSLTLRPFNSKQNYMIFLSGIKGDVSSQDLKIVLEEYGPILNCAILPSKKMNLNNAVATFSSQQNFKQVLADYKFNQKFIKFFAAKPYITVHMSAKQRNQYNDFRKKDKKTEQVPVMPMKVNFPFGGYPQQPSMMTGQFGANMMGQQMNQMGQMGQQMAQYVRAPIGNANNLNQK